MRRSAIALLAALCAAAALTSEAVAFTNGHAQARDLEPVFIPVNAPAGTVHGNSAFLAKGPAAASFHTMRLCAVREGVDLYPHFSTYRPAATAYRTGGVQEILWSLYVTGRGPPAAKPYWLNGVRVYTSNHGLGRAIDLDQTRMAQWVLNHGSGFGWSHAEGARVGEWWHYTYVGGFSRPDPGGSLRFPNLSRGSGGACQAQAVKEVQRRLGRPEDGSYGPQTVRAVRRFQRGHGLHVDGKVQSKTWLKLRQVDRGLEHGTDPRNVQQLPGQVAPMQGADVRAVQGLLNARFVELHRPQYRVKVTGSLDDATRVAIKRFQRLRKLSVTGRVDDATYAQLLKRIAKPSKTLTVTRAGTLLVAGFEGLRLCPYRDVVGVWTIGYGHTGGVSSASRCLTRGQALALLHRDLGLFALGVTRLVKVKLSSRSFNAYVSFSYNVGLGAFGSSTLLRELNARHYRAACDQLLRWNRAGGRVLLGLDRRRRSEWRMCLAGLP